MSDVTLCKSCGADIRWVVTEGGKAMPLDPLPHPNGNVIVGLGGRYRVLDGSQLPAEVAAWRSHFATCPRAAEHRRRGRPPRLVQAPPAPPQAPAPASPDEADTDDQLALFDAPGGHP